MGQYEDISLVQESARGVLQRERFARQWQKSARIEDREIEDPILVGDNVKHDSNDPLDAVCAAMIASDMPDIREAAKKNREEGVIGETGAESFFCDSMQCIKQKDEVLTLCGMENHDDVIAEHLTELCEDYTNMHDSIKLKRKHIAKQEKLLEALAAKLGYDHITFTPEGVLMVKDGITSHFPPRKRRRETSYGSWDA